MNILRELRKFKRKSVLVKLRILLLFTVMLIMSAYAWYRLPPTDFSGVRATVETWDIEYNMDGSEIQEEEITIAVEDFQPGMEDFEKTILIRNLGTEHTEISYELTSVKLFGEEVLTQLQDNGEIMLAGTTVNLFANPVEEKYPFKIFYTYDKKYLQGIFVDEETTPGAMAKITFCASWDYEQGKDSLDTEFGKKAYEYYSDPSNPLEEVLQFTLKITSKAVHL